MCLSTAYNKDIDDSRIMMENVMTVECSDGEVTLIDLFGHRLTVKGSLIKASLTDGYVILNAEE